jgi:hypothetical protein
VNSLARVPRLAAKRVTEMEAVLRRGSGCATKMEAVKFGHSLGKIWAWSSLGFMEDFAGICGLKNTGIH